MRAYVIRRILLVIPTLFIVTVLVFLSVRFIPGDIIDVMKARMTDTQGGTIDEEALKRRLGLDKPVYAQYAKWIGDIVLRGTLGRSLYSSSLGSATVEQKLAGRVGVTVELGLLAILTGVIIAVPIGIYSAIRQYTLADYAGRAVAIFGLATPNFWLGLM
ncbi:MAG: ABC transporter permease, partial [Spirochaetaceae bacterium]|nr:ABC transporter permease [Spirochaetaceae bacterium]